MLRASRAAGYGSLSEMFKKLRIFISSTSDLTAERDAVERALADLETDDSRFEAWPSSPRSPEAECLSQVDDCDALILILGSRYGSLASDSSLSVTHIEYQRARAKKLPIFPFLLSRGEMEDPQGDFIEEVETEHFRCNPIETTSELEAQVKSSLLAEFVRCFREIYSPPGPGSVESHSISVPTDPAAALAVLQKAFSRQDELAIHKVAEACEQRFGSDARILEVVYANEVNLAMHSTGADRERINRAIGFWEDQEPASEEAKALLKYNQGNAAHTLGLLEEARKFLSDSRKLDPGHAETWKNLGNVLLDLGKKEEAYECFDTAIELDPQLAEGLQSLGAMAMDAGDYPRAIAILERVPTEGLGPNRVSYLSYWKALAYARAGRIDEAIESVETCIRLTPAEEWAWAIGAHVHSLARHHSDDYVPSTTSFFRRLVSKTPYSAAGWAELGFSLWATRELTPEANLHLQETADAFNRAVELGFEDHGLIFDRLGHLHQTMGARAEAEEHFRRAASKSPDLFGCCVADFFLSEERFSEALPHLKELSETRSEDSAVWNRLGRCYNGLRRTAESIEAYLRSIALDETRANSWFNLAGIYWNAGNTGEAERVWISALELFPDHELAEQARKLLDSESERSTPRAPPT